MRKDTLIQINSAVGMLENKCLNDKYEDDYKPMSLDEAIKYAMYCFKEEMGSTYGFNTAVKFDGIENIKNEIAKQIKENKNIELV